MGPINTKEMFIFRNNEHDFNKLHEPAFNSRFMHRSYLYITSRLWNNLIVLGEPHLFNNVFKTMLNDLNLTIGVKCYSNFCT